MSGNAMAAPHIAQQAYCMTKDFHLSSCGRVGRYFMYIWVSCMHLSHDEDHHSQNMLLSYVRKGNDP